MNYMDDIQFHQFPIAQNHEINFRTDFYDNRLKEYSGKSKDRVVDKHSHFLDYAATGNSY